MAKGKLFLVSACSGAGKTSLVTQLIADIGASCQLERVVTYTTKCPRACEKHGVDYHFVQPHEFEQKLAEGFFLEWSDAYGAYYGTPRSCALDVEQGNGSRIVIIDRIGAEKVLSALPEAVSIWLYTQNVEDLKNRLISRNADSVEQIEERLQIAKGEIEKELKFPLYNYHILNDNFEVALKELKQVIQGELDNTAQL